MTAPAGLPVLDLDPFDIDVLCAPHDYYRALRAAGPLVWLSRYQVVASGHIDVVEPVFRDWRRFCSSLLALRLIPSKFAGMDSRCSRSPPARALAS